MWFVLVFIKLVLVYGQVSDIARGYAEVFELKYNSKVLFDVLLSIPIILLFTAPILFLTETWRFFFLYSEEEIFDWLEEIKHNMPEE
ncbi:hypothetical protein [Candidatus Albibeggiatoa sp. nov. BB20]|uniref:hypothetical protein n=1 Tax=Candidatus Albibeggiatoa sp. nov. BB20 TaxID=3162723 RepID=UPI0033657022